MHGCTESVLGKQAGEEGTLKRTNSWKGRDSNTFPTGTGIISEGTFIITAIYIYCSFPDFTVKFLKFYLHSDADKCYRS